MRRRRAGVRDLPAFDWPAYLIAVLLAGAILFGGGGAEGQLNNGVVYAASAFGVLGLAAAHWQGIRRLGDEAVLPVWLLAGFLILGAIQLVPLPPAVWHGLPGRDLAESALKLTSAGNSWRPLSLDPEATRRSMAALLLPAAMMLAMLGATSREALLLLRTIIACAVLSSMIGALQIALGYPHLLTYYEGANSGAASGVFANANHAAALLLAAIVCVGLAVRLRRRDDSKQGRAHKYDLTWLLLPLFAVMTLASGSRAGSLLLVLAVPASLVAGLGRKSLRIWVGTLVGVALLSALVSTLSPSANDLAIGQSAIFSDDKRSAILPDVLFTMRQYWPWGSGFGTFISAFAANENLDVAGREFVNHAHNDVLELVIESGIAGALWLAVAAALIAYRAVVVQFGRGDDESQAAAAWTGLFILALFGLHSLVDYPLRTPSIAAVAGIAVGLVFIRLRDTPAPAEPRSRSRWAVAIGAAGALILGAQVLRMYAAQAAVRAGNDATSVALRPQNGSGLALAAEQELARHHNARARALASEAIARSPLSARAVRVLATVNDLDGRGGMEAWRVVSAMGWRDPPTQFWAMQQALANGEFETAAIRADALLRTAGPSLQDRMDFVRTGAANGPFRKQLVRRLELEPRWKSAFFNISPSAPGSQLQGVLLVLQDLSSSPSRPSIREAGSAIRALIERKQYARAIALYQGVSGTLAADSMKDLSFDRSTDHYLDETNPFAWSFGSKSGTVTSVEHSDNTRVLLMGTDGRDRYQPIRRYIALASGTYRLGYTMRGAADSPETLGITVHCADSKEPLATSPTAPMQTSGFEHRQIRFTVPESCRLLLLAFETKENDQPTQAEFANLSLHGP